MAKTRRISKKNIILIILTTLILSSLFVALLIILNNKESNEEQVLTKMNTNKVNAINYVVTSGGKKENISKDVAEDKKIGDILIEGTTLTYNTQTTKLNAKLMNDSIAKDNLKIKAKFISSNGSFMAESVILIGKISANATKDIDININMDLSNTSDITYEIVK